MQDARQQLKWADGKAIKNEVDMQVLDILGPKTEEDKKPIPKAVKAKPEKQKTDKDNIVNKKKENGIFSFLFSFVYRLFC